ncbi:hypothetical protein TanjilG_03515 [Lupinus angustifolius]|uniref:Protein kinase domain-containing protein n=1 Tax=Lupinus angustifolius TaxID=3871 RepID=A0A1J7IVT1_LUPAN|nr:hypothetical protein TanjilG_03515 [Lupinus angustifolius]
MVLQLLKLCIIGFALAVQGSKGPIITLSPAILPAIPPIVETPGPIHHGESSESNAPSLPSDPDGFVISPPPSNLPVHSSPSETPGPLHPKESRGTIAPSSPALQNGSFLNPPNTLPPPASAPTPPKIEDTEPSISPSPSFIVSSPPLHEVVPSPSTVQGNVPPPIKSSPPQGEEPAVRPPVPTQTAPAPVAIHFGGSPKISPVSQPSENGTLAPNVDNRNANKSHTAVPLSPAPVATPSTNFANNSAGSPPTEHGTFPPKEAPEAVNLPNISPVSQPIDHGSLPPIVHQRNASTWHIVSPATVAIPPATIEKNSTFSQPTQHGSVPPNVHKGIANKGHNPETLSPESLAPPPWKEEHKPPAADPIVPTITPSILPVPVTSPVTSPASVFPVNQPLVHPIIPAVSPSKLPVPVASPMSTPSRSFNWTKGRPPVTAPSYKKLKPLPAVIHSPAQDQALPPSLPPKSGRRHHVPQPVNPGSSVPPLFSPIHSPKTQALPASSPSIKSVPQPIKSPVFPPKVSPVTSSSKSPKTPPLPQVQALPPPPPNQDCLTTVCSEPYTNSPPGAPCRCVWPMQVGLRLGVSLYTFFPLVTELASEISGGVFMKQSQVRIMGANAANQQPEKTVVLIDLVPLGEKFDNTTASFISDRFWHKRVVIKASYFGDYDVLYVNYPGLPPSPPLPPSSITVIDGGPYSGNGNDGRTIKPLGVDIQKRQHKGGLSRGIIAIIAVSVFLAVILCVAAAWVMFKFRDHESQPASTPQVSQPSVAKAPGTSASVVGGGVGSNSTSFRSSIAAYAASAKTFSMNDIEKATDNFNAARILGEGGFGLVYSGILEDGTEVAVKVLKREDHHGDREFLAEVEMLSRLHHRNLVKLIGICTEDTFRCLVYELVPNGSVEYHLHGVDKENSPLDWGTRMKIALGAARGLAYLHEDSTPHVIHRDFKSSNILLEDDFTAKVSDFGLARTAMDEDNRHISTRVMGTFGYVAPEYAMTGHLLVKSDVYSYGVVLLELLTGRKPVDMSQPPGQENLVAWARPLLTSNVGLETIIDPSLGADVPIDSVAKVAAIASMCVQPEVSNRPFMGEVVQALKLVCSECDEAKEEAGLRSCSQEDLFVDLDVEISPSGQLEDNLERRFSGTNFDTGLDIERGMLASELFNSSARFGRQESESFRRHSYSGPLRTGKSRRLWQIMRRLSGGTVTDNLSLYLNSSFFVQTNGCVIYSYEATTSRKTRSLAQELITGAVASVFLGFGSLFLLLASGVYV